MTPDELRALLQQSEGPTLDFKQRWYTASPKGVGRERHRDETIKDILSLANGNAQTAGQPAYLVIGPMDKLNPDGTRSVESIGDDFPSRDDVLRAVNPAVTPPLLDVDVHMITIENDRIGVITIGPSPYLHETTRDLKTTEEGPPYRERTVFTRRGTSIAIASHEERMAIQAAKRDAFKRSKPLSLPVMMIAGAVFSGVGTWAALTNALPAQQLGRSLGSAIAGGVVAAMGTLSVNQFPAAWRQWNRGSWIDRGLMLLIFLIILGIGWWIGLL